MASIKEFFNLIEDSDEQQGVAHKNNLIKRDIIAHMALNGQYTLAELTRELHVSIPTITKLVNELIDDKIVADKGKLETSGGRRPNVYDLADSAIYFAGIDVNRDHIYYVITDLKNNIVKEHHNLDFTLEDTPEALEFILSGIEEFIDNCGIKKNKILGCGICFVGRINPETGHSYRYFTNTKKSLRDTIEERIDVKVLLENDVRAWTYAEYFTGNIEEEKNILYYHIGRGVAIGIVIDGQLYYGKSGFAGEFGHTPFYDNEIICSCGKKGCLETEISGIAIEEKMVEKIEDGVNTILRERYEKGETIHIDDIIEAVISDDTLSIELIEEAGEKIGYSIAFLVNIFNPELVIIGGNLARAGDYIMFPIKAATNKYSLSYVFKDTTLKLSEMPDNTGALGSAMLIRNKIIGL